MRRAVIQVCSKPVSKKIRETLQNQRFSYLQSCRRPESNRYGYHYPRDFKSRASASSATAARDAHTVFVEKHTRSALSFLTSHQWAEVDSNHRSKLQQIYSLSPFGHSGIHPFCLSTISIYIINKRKAQGNLSNSPALFPNFYTQNDHAAFI